MKVDLTDSIQAQDMVNIIMEDNDYLRSYAEAIKFAVNDDADRILLNRIMWLGIALKSWGHDDPYKEFEKLDNPVIDVDFTEKEEEMIRQTAIRYAVDLNKAVMFYLTITMHLIGYHI